MVLMLYLKLDYCVKPPLYALVVGRLETRCTDLSRPNTCDLWYTGFET